MSAGLDANFDAGSLALMLCDAGIVDDPSIVSVRRRLINLQSTSALLVRLLLTFEDDRQGDMPDTLVLKTASTHPAAAAFAAARGHYRREVRFYRDLAPHCTARLPQCYAASLAGDGTPQFHLLLEDCLPGCVQYSSPLGLDHTALGAAVDWLAGFHAQWICAPKHVAVFVDEGPTWEALGEEDVNDFIHTAGEHLSLEERCLCREVLAAWSRLGGLSTGPATLRHGDFHPLNLFFKEQAGVPLVIDWQFCEIGTGTMDLVDLLCLHCHPQDRRQLGETLVRRYWQGLCEAGVTGYAWDACWENFVIDITRAVMKPVFLCAIPSLPTWAAISRFKQAALAFDDLGCRRLLPLAKGRQHA